MANTKKLQLFRSLLATATKALAILKLKQLLPSAKDGEILIARYKDGDNVKSLLGISGTGLTVGNNNTNYTILDVPESVSELDNDSNFATVSWVTDNFLNRPFNPEAAGIKAFKVNVDGTEVSSYTGSQEKCVNLVAGNNITIEANGEDINISTGGLYEILNELPEEGDSNKIYLIPGDTFTDTFYMYSAQWGLAPTSGSGLEELTYLEFTEDNATSIIEQANTLGLVLVKVFFEDGYSPGLVVNSIESSDESLNDNSYIFIAYRSPSFNKWAYINNSWIDLCPLQYMTAEDIEEIFYEPGSIA